MEAPNYSELTDSDLACIERGTVPLGNAPDLVSRTTDGGVVFSIRALKIYSAVCARHGLQQELALVKSWESYAVLKQKIFRMCTLKSERELRQALAAGVIPLQDRELSLAILSDDRERIAAAGRRRNAVLSAGPNVIPIESAKKGPL